MEERATGDPQQRRFVAVYGAETNRGWPLGRITFIVIANNGNHVYKYNFVFVCLGTICLHLFIAPVEATSGGRTHTSLAATRVCTTVGAASGVRRM